MALNQNQFKQTVIAGMVDQANGANNVINCQVDANLVGTLVAGQPVKFVDSTIAVPQVTALVANTDKADGVVVYVPSDKSTYAAGDRLAIAIAGSVVYMTAGGVIKSNAFVECVASTSKVINSAGTNPKLGRVFGKKASADTDLVRVYILSTSLASV